MKSPADTDWTARTRGRGSVPGTAVLAVDLGGTNLTVALMETAERPPRFLASRRYSTRDQSGLVPVLRNFMEDFPSPKAAALCVAGAGVVNKGRIDLSNVPWPVEAAELERELGLPVALINDFSAVMKGILALNGDDARYFLPFTSLRPDARRFREAPVCALGAGTGLGCGFALPGDDGWLVCASEAGNARPPVWDRDSADFVRFLEARIGAEPCAEDVLSGRGIASLHGFLAERRREKSGAGPAIRALPENERPAAIAAAANEDPVCSATMDRFFDGLAVFASDLALTFLPRSGLFLAGGIVAKNLAHLESGRFMRRFLQHRKRICVDLLQDIPVAVVKEYSISLIGAAVAASNIP